MTDVNQITDDGQDRDSPAWKALCAYIDKVAVNLEEEFAPLEALGAELFAQIYTLPASISTLKKVKKVWLYGSSLKRIPPEIGEMESLEYFDPYTSYKLRWFPYEITRCQHLKDSRVSTRALFGNHKNHMGFPDLSKHVVKNGDTVSCSICRTPLTYEQTSQYWISLWVGTDVLPLLVNVCSNECLNSLPQPTKHYIKFPHKGGSKHIQPSDAYTLIKDEMKPRGKCCIPGLVNLEEIDEHDSTEIKAIKLIRKIWD